MFYCNLLLKIGVKKACAINDCRFLSSFSKYQNTRAVDDVYATLALMYGYAASYAPSNGIEARIETLVVTTLLLFQNSLISRHL